jgi:hypothetical protein
MVEPLLVGEAVARRAELQGSFFGNLFHKFSHMLKHVAAFATEFIAPAFGIPPGVAASLTELVLHAHAGDHHARAKIQHLAKDPKLKAAMKAISTRMREHPHFVHLKTHRQQHAA